MASLIFFDGSYWKNPHFQRCMRNWNKFLETEVTDDDELAEWEEVLMKDFLQHSREWFKRNKNMIHWRLKLE